MKQPSGGLVDRACRIWQDITEKQISVYAANASYFVILALFPMLVLLLGMLRYTGLEVTRLTDLVEGFLPEALMPAARRLILNAYRNSTGTVLSLSAVTALWSASRGIYGLIQGLNRICDVTEDRGYWRTRSLSVGYTFAFLLVLVLTLGLNVFGKTLLTYGAVQQYPFLAFLSEIVNLRFFLLLGVQTALFTAAFAVLPNQRIRFRDALPGALLAAIGWMVFTQLYSLYVTGFPAYAGIYGSVYAVAVSMLWLYCCISILFYGGALNHYLTTQST